MTKGIHKPFLLISGIAGFVVVSSLLYQAFPSHNMPKARKITIGMDVQDLAKLNKYPSSGDTSFAENNSVRNERLRNLPRYPLSKRIMSVTEPGTSLFIYESRAEPMLITHFYAAEMERRGWIIYPQQFGEGTALFHRGKTTCLLNVDRDSGITTITVVYLSVGDISRCRRE